MWVALLNIFLCLGGINGFEDSWGQYTWVKWSGNLPKNALNVGFDHKNRLIYVGRIFENGELFPVQIAMDPEEVLPIASYNGYEHKVYDFEIFVPLLSGLKVISWASPYYYDAKPIAAGIDYTHTKDYFVCLAQWDYRPYVGKTFGDQFCTITTPYGDTSVSSPDFKMLSIQ